MHKNITASAIKFLESAFELLFIGQTKKAHSLVTSMPEKEYEESLRLYDSKKQDYHYYLSRYVLFSFELISKYNLTEPAEFDNLPPGKKKRVDNKGLITLSSYKTRLFEIRNSQELPDFVFVNKKAQLVNVEGILSKPYVSPVKKRRVVNNHHPALSIGLFGFQVGI